MKTIFFFAMLGLSMNAFAQGKPPLPNGQIPFNYTIKNSKQERLEKMRNPSGVRSEYNFKGMSHHEAMMLLTPIQLVDSVYSWEWDTLSGEWLTDRRTMDIAYDDDYNLKSYTDQEWNGQTWDTTTQTNYTYDAFNNLIQEVILEWKNNAWENSFNETYTYDEQKNQTSSASQVWYSGSWYNEYKTINTFDSINNLTSRTSQDGSGSDWLNSFQDLYTYDSLSNLTLEVTRYWYENENDWKDITQVIYTYDTNSNLKTELEQDRLLDAWINEDIYVYTYDAKDSLFHSIYKGWNANAGAWDSYQQTFFTYDLDLRQTIETYQEWNENVWQNSSKYIYTYNVDNVIIGQQIQFSYNDTWENLALVNYSYNSNNNLTEYSSYLWGIQDWIKTYQYKIGYDADNFMTYLVGTSFNDDGVTVQYADSTHVYFHKIIVSDETVPIDQKVDIWPNPSSGEVTFSAPLEKDIRNISVFDMNGRLVHTVNGINQNFYSMRTGNVSPGIYIVRLLFNHGVITCQIVIQ